MHYLGCKIFRSLVLPPIYASNSNEALIKFPEMRREPGPQTLSLILPNASPFPQKLTETKERWKEGQLYY